MERKRTTGTSCNLLDCLSTSALKMLLEHDLSDSEGEMAPESIEYIVRLLEKRDAALAAARESISVDAAWAKFNRECIMPMQGKVPTLVATDPEPVWACEFAKKQHGHGRRTKIKLRPVLQKAGLMAATVCILLAGMMSAQASGIDVFGALAKWTDETFHFAASNANNSIYQENIGNAEWLNSTLTAYSLSTDLVPTWYPDGYTISGVETHQDGENLQIFYSCEDGEGGYFSVQILRYEDPAELSSYTIEKSEEDVETVRCADKEFYILTNEDTLTATWSDGHILESISGNFPKDDLLHIIKSIGGQ